MKKILLASALLLGTTVLLTSCKKEYTTVQQNTGAYSYTDVLSPSEWQLSNDGSVYYADFLDFSSNSNNLFIGSQDAVLVYVDFDNATNGYFDGPLATDHDGYHFRSYHSNDIIGLDYYPLDGHTLTSSDKITYSIKVKVVIVQAELLSQHPNVNLKDYDEVIKTFNVQDQGKFIKK